MLKKSSSASLRTYLSKFKIAMNVLGSLCCIEFLVWHKAYSNFAIAWDTVAIGSSKRHWWVIGEKNRSKIKTSQEPENIPHSQRLRKW